MHAKALIRVGGIVAALALMAIQPARVYATLLPDQILLVYNQDADESVRLADLYCQLRNIPRENMLGLHLDPPQSPSGSPNGDVKPIHHDQEEMSFDAYEWHVVAPIRQFLHDHHMEAKIRCLVTFYGVPFRVAGRKNTPDEVREQAELKAREKAVMSEASADVTDLERQTAELDPKFKPPTTEPATDKAMVDRIETAVTDLEPRINALTDPLARAQQGKRLMAAVGALGGAAEVDGRFGMQERLDPSDTPETRHDWELMHRKVQIDFLRATQLKSLRWDPKARADLRNVAAQTFGLLGLENVLFAQIQYLEPENSTAATDNELALLWDDYYPRENWLPNTLNYHYNGPPKPTLMVMRLDGPNPGIVEKLLYTGLQVEKTGLQGIIAINARGRQPIDSSGKIDAYGRFDARVRNLALLVRTHTKMRMAFRDEEPVFAPHSVHDVALYVGWYSVNHYIPGMIFNTGAVGYHVASYEMVHLHTPANEWVRGLMTDGVVDTLGACAEPYLSSFPFPDEYFPLVLSGKLNMAEVYWRTTPDTSWMISCIGDPLYTPYKTNPQWKVEDLPGPLRAVAEESDVPWQPPTVFPAPPASSQPSQ